MLTRKRIFMTAAIRTNLVVFVLPGFACLCLAIDQLAFTGRPLFVGDPFEFGALGFTLLAFGIFNLAYLNSACKSCGSHWGWTIGLGVALCAFTAIWTMGILLGGRTIFIGMPLLIPSFMLGAVTFTTAGALWQLRPIPIPDWQCQHCEYDLRGLERTTEGGENGVCPECGNETSAEAGNARV